MGARPGFSLGWAIPPGLQHVLPEETDYVYVFGSKNEKQPYLTMLARGMEPNLSLATQIVKKPMPAANTLNATDSERHTQNRAFLGSNPRVLSMLGTEYPC